MIAMLAMMALSQTPQHRLVFQPNLQRLGSGSVPFSLSSAASFTFGGNIGALPVCTGDAHCVALCYVSSGTTWACKGNSGADVGVISQGVSPGSESTFAPGALARSAVGDLSAPTATGAAFSNLMAGDFTIMSSGIWHANGVTGNSAYVSIGDATNLANLFSMFSSPTTFTCSYGESGVYPNATVSGPLEGWAVVSCRRGGNNRIARVNGTDGTTVSTAGTRGIDAGLTVGFGRERPLALGRNLAGPLAWVAFYDESKSTTWLRGTENAYWGVGLDAGLGLSGLIGLADDAGANVNFFAAGAHVVSVDLGLRTVAQQTDNIQAKWATDPFDVSAWTNVGTPLVGADRLLTSPFARWLQDGGCWNLEDDSAAAFEGKESAELQRTNGTEANHGWNMKVWASKGDSGTTRDRMRIAIVAPLGVFLSDGGAEEDCDFTLDDTIKPYECVGYTTDAGVTSVKGRVLVGNAAATTGSATVCNAQDTAHVYSQLSVANTTAFGASGEQLDPSGWPFTTDGGSSAQGKYEIVFTPINAISTPQWDNGHSLVYLFDAYTSSPVHSAVFVYGYQMAGRALARVTGPSGNATEFLVDNTVLVPGQRYAASLEWRPVGADRCNVWYRFNSCSGALASCMATSIQGSLTDGTGYCPAQPEAVKLGNRYDNTVPTSVFVNAVRVYQ